MNKETIIEKIKNKEYEVGFAFPRMDFTTKEGYITDENKSVKWNKEQVVKNKERIVLLQHKYNTVQLEKYNMFKNDVIEYLKDYANFSTKVVRPEIYEYIFDRAWEDSHSEGYEEILETAITHTNFIKDVLLDGIE